MKSYLLSFVLLVVVNCSTSTNKQSDNENPERAQAEEKKATKDTILYQNEALHYFSSLVDKDSFQIYVTGESILGGQLFFRIKTGYGKTILDETYPSSYLLGYGIDQNATNEQKEEFIKKRVSEFFLETTFRQPALGSNEGFDEDYSDKEVWDEISSDTTAIGFGYLIGEEDNRWIAYSKKMNKVVIYFNCC